VLERIRVMIARKRGPRKALLRENEVTVLPAMTHDVVTVAS
jgi:hypothetical protein